VTRNFRHATYHIEVDNPAHVSKGVRSMTVDGKAMQGNLIPVFNDGQHHAVKITMG
jgi:cellobiose phosphorylase